MARDVEAFTVQPGFEGNITSFYNRLMAQAETERSRGNDERADDLEAQAINYLEMNLKDGNKPKVRDFNGTTKSDNYRPTKAWSKLHDSVPISERHSENQTALSVDEVDKKQGKKPVSASDRKQAIFDSVPQIYDPEAHQKNKQALKSAREYANLLKEDARKEANADKRADTHADALISHIIKKSGWSGLVRAVAKGNTEFGNKGHKKEINPEAIDLIKGIAEELSGQPLDTLTDKERKFMNVWNGKGEYTEAFENDLGVAEAMSKVKALSDESKKFTAQKAEQNRLFNKALSDAAGRERHTVDIDINTRGGWRGFRVVDGGASNAYALHVETDENGEKRAVGYLVYGDNQVDTDKDPVFNRPLSEFNDSFESALKAFKSDMEGILGKHNGTWKNKGKEIKQKTLDFTGKLLLNQDYDEALTGFGKSKLEDILKKNGLVVEAETNKIMRPEDLPEGAKTRKVYETDEEREALRKAGIPTQSKNLGGQEGYMSLSTGSGKGGKKQNGQTKAHIRNHTIDPKTGEKVYSNKDSIKKGNEGWNKATVVKGAAFGNQDLGSDKAKEQLRRAEQKQDDAMNLQKEAKQKALLDKMDPQKVKNWEAFNVLKGFKF